MRCSGSHFCLPQSHSQPQWKCRSTSKAPENGLYHNQDQSNIVRNSRVLRSPPFKFLVGPKAKQYTIHSALAAQHSPHLKALICGKTLEAERGWIELDDVDEDAFSRVVSFMYCGDYKSQGPEILAEDSDSDDDHEAVTNVLDKPQTESADRTNSGLESTAISEGEISGGEMNSVVTLEEKPTGELSDAFWAFTPSVKRRKKKTGLFGSEEMQAKTVKPKRSEMWEQFESRKFDISTACESFQPRKNNGPDEMYTEVLLSHAAVYVLADRFLMPGLKQLALHKLHKTLVCFKLFPERVSDVVALLKYTYDKTGHKDPIDELRDVVLDYATWALEDLQADESFNELLRGGGDFVVDLVTRTLRRLD